MKTGQKTGIKDVSGRLRFPEDEAKQAWLPMLLDAYAVIDRGVAVAIKKEKKKNKAKLACGRGCDNCCRTMKDIPVYPLELVGIYWYAVEKLTQPAREQLKNQLMKYDKAGHCPFLVNHICAIHPLRAVACRQFNVFNKACREGEDPYYTRREDVLSPIQEYTNEAISLMLPFYGIKDEASKRVALQQGLIHTKVRVLQACNWTELAARMDSYDSKGGEK